MKSFPLLVAASLVAAPLTRGDSASDTLLRAAGASDAERLVLALAEAPVDARDGQGRTALMLAAKAGSFECAKRLLWAGADARLKDPSGQTARDFLDGASPSYGPLSLLLRCHAFCQEFGRPGGKVKTPHLAMVNDPFVDYAHPFLGASYQINSAEASGRKGVDDDRNGFVDDVYGWNLNNNEPVAAPMLSIDNSPEAKNFLSALLTDYLKANNGDQTLMTRLKSRYDNPLVRQIGLQNLLQENIQINDYTYAKMFMNASHGTHVAGIIKRASQNRAKITCATIGATVSSTVPLVLDQVALGDLAAKSPDYGTFVTAVLDRYRGEAIVKGRRASDYLRANGAGVANMSWGRPKPFFEGAANRLETIYRLSGADPASIGRKYEGAVGAKIADLALELSIADAAAFALAFYENPNVFIVIAAGNERKDNDTLLPSPQYLSRFFPNVITIASVNDQGAPSSFSNFGVRSVQLAAPGEQIRSSILGGFEAPMSGTSMAAPFVAGVAAGIRFTYPRISATDLRRILEYSARKSSGLSTIVSSSGAIDEAAAYQLASTWGGATGSMLLAEVARDKRPGQDGPKLTAPGVSNPKLAALKLLEPGRNPIPVPPVANKPTPTPKPAVPSNPVLPPLPKSPAIAKGWRITSSGGFQDSWRVVMSKPSPYGDQAHLGTGPWPSAEIEKFWKLNYRISSVAGSADGWNVVMSKGMPGGQRVVGMDFDQEQISKLNSEGWRITSVAGWKNQWIFVMGDQTGYGTQRYTLPTPLNDSRRDWINKRWDEGMRITTVAGDDNPEDPDDGWLFVASQNSGYTEQTMEGPGPWPGLWIAGRLREGYRITSVAGTPAHSIVVMSKGTKLGEQVISDGTGFPDAWIKARW